MVGIALLAGLLVVVSLAARGRYFNGTSDADLTKLARAVPVPKGVTLDREFHQTVTPGLFTHYRVVNLVYKTSLSCDELLSEWKTVLQADHPTLHQGIAPDTSVVILQLDDNGIKLGIALEGVTTSQQTQCGTPHVDASGSTYHSL